MTFAACLLLSLAAQSDEEGFAPLFNGRDFTGWRYDEKFLEGAAKTPDGRFEIHRGVIILNEKPADEEKDIRTLETVIDFDHDFQLRVEFRAGEKAESGVRIRNRRVQLKASDTEGWRTAEFTVTSGHPAVRFNGKSVTPGDDLRWRYAGGKVSAVLNGKEVDPVNLSMTRISKTRVVVDGEVVQEGMRTPNGGAIGLAAEKGRFEFRNIRIRMLD